MPWWPEFAVEWTGNLRTRFSTGSAGTDLTNVLIGAPPADVARKQGTMMITRLRRLAAAFAGQTGSVVQAAPDQSALQQRLAELETKTEYLHLEVSKLRSFVRYLIGENVTDLPLYRQTMDSFDFQWQGTVSTGWTPADVENIKQTVATYTGLDPSWFAGKRVLDAGCGSGRFAFTLASLGARVTAIDQSASALRTAKANCGELAAKIDFRQVNLLDKFELPGDFDLVWSFGVLHHTGNTYLAFRNVARLVRPGGFLFVMLYGEPQFSDTGAFGYYAEVENLRRKMSQMTFEQRHELLKTLKGADAGGWFDAVSPIINDTYSMYEIEGWMSQLGFVDVRQTIEHPNHHVIARKV